MDSNNQERANSLLAEKEFNRYILEKVKSYIPVYSSGSRVFFSYKKNKMIRVSDLKYPTLEMLEEFMETEHGKILFKQFTNAITKWNSFIPAIIKKICDEISSSPPIAGISFQHSTGKNYLLDCEYRYQLKNKNLELLGKSFCKSAEFKIDKEWVCISPRLIYKFLYDAIKSFRFKDDEDRCIFVLHTLYLPIWTLLKRRINGVITGKTGSGKTALSCIVGKTTSSSSHEYRGYCTIPNSQRVSGESGQSAIRDAMDENPSGVLIIDEGHENSLTGNIERIMHMLRASMGGGEEKRRSGFWTNQKNYTPVFICGVKIPLSTEDASRFIRYELLPPEKVKAEGLQSLTVIKENQNSLITGLLTCLVNHVDEINNYIAVNPGSDRAHNVFLPLSAIASVIFSDEKEKLAEVSRAIENKKSYMRVRCKENVDAKVLLKKYKGEI